MSGNSGQGPNQETLYTSLKNDVWNNEEICEEARLLKKGWYVRDGRMVAGGNDWKQPIMYIMVKKTEKQLLSFGPVMGFCLAEIPKGKGRKKELLIAPNFLTLGGKRGFTSLVLDMEFLDIEAMGCYPEDQVVEAALQMDQDERAKWFKHFIVDCEAELLLPFLTHYEKSTGQQFKRKIRLKVTKPSRENSAATPTTASEGARTSKGTPKRDASSGVHADQRKGKGPASDQDAQTMQVEQSRQDSVALSRPNQVQDILREILRPEAMETSEASLPQHSESVRTEEEQTPLAQYETDEIKKELSKLIQNNRVQRTTILLHVTNLILQDDSDSSTLIRPVDDFHVNNIKTLLMQNPSNFTAPFVLVVDPNDCPSVASWDIAKAQQWRYRVVGGNHGARAKSELYKMYNKQIYGEVEAWVYAGLSKQDVRKLGWQHNIDQEYRKRMTNIDVVRACHNLFLEFNMEKSKHLREACCQECSLSYEPGKRDSMAKYDPTFQIAFRSGEIWDLTEQIFKMWQRFEILGQVKPKSPKKVVVAKGKGKPKPVSAKELTKLSGDINLHLFRALQGISKKEHVTQLLRRVVARHISLDMMYHEGEKLKKLTKVRNLFLQLSGQPDWETCRTLFPEETDVIILSVWADKLTEQLKAFSKRKRKAIVGSEHDEVATEEVPSNAIPQSFKSFVQEAIAKYNRSQNILSVIVASTDHAWKNADGDSLPYTLHVGDVRNLDSVLQPRHYTLAVADIPYGFNAPGSEFDDVAFTEQDVWEMIVKFSKVTTATMWRFVVIHSLQQTNMVMQVLEKCCNCGVEAGIWEKPNIHGLPSGSRLAWAFETWSIGYYNQTGVRSMDMYNFGPTESRSNIVKVGCVTKKSTTTLGCIVNPYQKPVGLGAWFVNHFSSKGEWVADLCCGTGGVLVASLLAGRSGSAVDRGETQIEYVRGRVMTLDSEWSPDVESLEPGDGSESQEVQPPIGKELGSIGTCMYSFEREEEEAAVEVEEVVPSELDIDFNAMLMGE